MLDFDKDWEEGDRVGVLIQPVVSVVRFMEKSEYISHRKASEVVKLKKKVGLVFVLLLPVPTNN